MSSLEDLIEQLINLNASALLVNSKFGLEKESLRVASDGTLSNKPHPGAFGAALTHPWITTDYSEALLELITPPLNTTGECLQFLCDIHSFVYANLDDEILWATSMPCVLAGETHIPIAEYGSSHSGKMKHVYRVGLGHRYGKVMQVIAGVHFNYSVAEEFWPVWAELQDHQGDLQSFIDAHYMGMIRNLQRYGWIIPYLFGASPAVCKSFFADHPTDMQELDEATFYEPFATSLRMSDIGYQNQKEELVGIKANYDSLADYINSLSCAITTSAPIWEEIGIKNEQGEYQQLNANILQIENEYYSTVRPKQVPNALEKPTEALRKCGIRYVELRSLDVNAFEPMGINESQMYFLEAFLLTCLFQESPKISHEERKEIDDNLLLTARKGRDPELHLSSKGQSISLHTWLSSILEYMQPICAMLDEQHKSAPYQTALNEQLIKVWHPELTPSAMMLNEMDKNGESFYQFASHMSQVHHRFFQQKGMTGEKLESFRKQAENSLRQQKIREETDVGSFDEFLEDYFCRSNPFA